MRPAGQTCVATATGDQGIHRDARAAIRTTNDGSGRFMPKDEGRRSSRIVPVIGVHVRAADADGIDADKYFIVAGRWLRFFAQ